jgi:hypothetical protein
VQSPLPRSTGIAHALFTKKAAHSASPSNFHNPRRGHRAYIQQQEDIDVIITPYLSWRRG